MQKQEKQNQNIKKQAKNYNDNKNNNIQNEILKDRSIDGQSFIYSDVVTVRNEIKKSTN